MPQLSLSLRIGGFALVAIAISLAAFLDADAQSPPPTVELEIAMDADASGNTGSSVGALDSCRVVSVGETFDLDIVLPEVPPPGFWGLGADIVYDPAVLQVMAFDYDLLLAQNQPFIPWDANNTTPDTDGDFRVDFVDLSGGPGETGPGAIGRVTFRAVGGGGTVVDLTDTLDVGGVLLISGAGEQYAISDVRDAEIVVGGSCPGLLSDSDGDNFKDAREDFIGTSVTRSCPATTVAGDESTDAWPPDMNDNTSVTITDVATFSSVFGKTSGSPGYSARHDLNGNNAITITDVAQFAPVFGTSCTP